MALQNPFAAGLGQGSVPPNPLLRQHGSSELWTGTVFASDIGGRLGMTPPQSPRRLTTRAMPRSPSNGRRDRSPQDGNEENNDRERETRRRPFQAEPTEEQPLPGGWGARMLSSENRIKELTEQITVIKKVVEGVNERANTKIDEMKNFVSESGVRFDNIEKALPERIHKTEVRQEGFINTLNEMTNGLQAKFLKIEEDMRAIKGLTPTMPLIPPSFGGPRAENFNIGSPLSAPPSQQPQASPSTEHDPWSKFAQSRSAYSSGGLNHPQPVNVPSPTPPTPAPGPAVPLRAPVTHKSWDLKLWSVCDTKVSKELKPFNGKHSTYKIWANRVKDHFIEKNGDWHYIFAEIETQKAPITRDLLKFSYINADGYTADVDFGWCASALWTLIGKHVIDSVYNNRNVLAGGHNNGLELWRAFFVKHEGGADQVELGGMGSLHSFPQCDNMESLQFWVGKWTEMKDAYGVGISDNHLRSMFINILPAAVQKEVREKPGLSTLQKCIDHVISDLGRLNDAQLSKLHLDRFKQSLSSTQRVSPVLEQEEQVEKPRESSNQ